MGLSRTDLTTIATRTGRRVVAAWSTRNAGTMGDVYGVVMHHTGSAWGTAVAPTLGVVQNGRSDLQNALCNYYIDRAGTIYLITEKIAWHAGSGSWRGITDGNGHFLGIEPESDGVHWNQATIDSYIALVAEICRFLGRDPNTWAIRHGQWAPTRKIDFSGLNEADFRAKVAARLGAAPTKPEDNDMTGAQEAVLQGILNWIVDPNIGILRQLGEVRSRVDQLVGNDPDGNQQDRLGDLWEQAARQQAELLAALHADDGTSAATGPAVLSDADVARIAKAVADENYARQKEA